MSKLTIYKYATWGLLFLNLAVLTFFLATKPKPPGRLPAHAFQTEVIEILKLNDAQVKTFRALAKDHNQKVTGIDAQQQNLLRPYFESLAKPSIDIDRSEALNQLQQLEREKIEVTFQHFQALKFILKEEQLTHFEEFINRYIDIFLVGEKKRVPPPKGFD